ncbi:hypothetical protein KGN15_000795 [Lactococcus lactis]|uniref:hypothetical protein n=1 Tax=Lactococcus lactis TaxID=1358 RepID=UPI001C1FD3CB|nr:hypothetical protein [Lactococcus lactis]MBU7532863.1 hypothetical protein [Lactococcus lactis]
MKKFRLMSNSLVRGDGNPGSLAIYVQADSYDDVIQEIESNAGWVTTRDCAFKVAYIEEVVE